MYENFYQLESSPFRLSPDPRFFFGSKCHNRALAYLRYGLKQKEGFIVVTGSPGTGKTMLARALLEDVGREKIVIAELNTTHLKPDDVLRMTAASFGLDHEGATKATLLQRLESYFLGRYRAGYHVLLIVDESQNLPVESIEELRMLSNFYTGKHALIQIFLLGQQQFRDRLYSADMEQLRQRVVASCHLEPLNQCETKEYIEHRLTLAGWQQDPQISDRAFARIYQMTKGVPRRINTFCDRLFLFCSLEEIHEIKDEQIKAIAKELMCEISTVDDEGKSIDSSAAEKTDGNPEIDSNIFDNLSDDVAEKKIEKATPRDIKVTPKEKIIGSYSSKTSPISIISQGNIALQSYELNENTDSESQPDWWRLVALAVNNYRNPSINSILIDHKAPLFEGVTEILQVAVGKKKVTFDMKVGELQDVDDETIHRACVHHIKTVWITNKANYYRRLGVDENASLSHIRTHYRYLFRLLQTELDAENKQDENAIRRINQSFSVLRSETERREYDAFLLQVGDDQSANDFSLHSQGKRDQGDINDTEKTSTNKSSRRLFLPFALSLVIGSVSAAYYYQVDINDLFAQVKERSNNLLSHSNNEKNSLLVDQVNNSSASLGELDAVLVGDVVFDDVLAPELNPAAATTSYDTELVKDAQVMPLPMPTNTILKQTLELERVSEQPQSVVVSEVKRVANSPKKIILPEPTKQATSLLAARESKVVNKKPESIVQKKTITKTIVAPAEISDMDLLGFSTTFSQAYKEGNLDKFMTMFSLDVSTNDNKEWSGIREDYQGLFDSTEIRKIELLNMMWEKDGHSAIGNGNFIVTVQNDVNEGSRKFNGKIKFEVNKEENQTYIMGMYYSYADE